jgi:hypothetical protein
MHHKSSRRYLDRRERCLLWIFVVGLTSGCMNQQLRLTARQTMSILPDLHYQQVIDNLAAIASNPGVLPYLAIAGQGSVQVTDNGHSSLELDLKPSVLTSSVLGAGASRNVTGTWSLGTITSPEKIRGMQAVYERAILGSTEGDEAFAWLNIGCKRDVPRDACYVGRHDATRVWVMPQGMSKLSDLTLAIVDIATREDAEPARPENGGSPRRSIGPPPVPRRNFQVPQSGPVYTPGVR